MITFSDHTAAYTVMYIGFPVLIFISLKRPSSDDPFSLNNTSIIKGMAILLIALHHFAQAVPGSHMRLFVASGYLSASMFFFLSGYGLASSYLINGNKLEGFIQRRLFRVVIPFVIVNILTLIYNYYSGDMVPNVLDIAYILGLKLLDCVMWYVVVTLMLYMAFYLIYKYLDTPLSHIVLVIFIMNYSVTCYLFHVHTYWFMTTFAFPIGIITEYYNKYTVHFARRYRPHLIVAAAFTFMISYYVVYMNINGYALICTYISSFSFLLIVLCILLTYRLQSRLFNALGIISYELYLVHNKVINPHVINTFGESQYLIVVFIALVVILSVVLHKALRYLIVHFPSKIRNSTIATVESAPVRIDML